MNNLTKTLIWVAIVGGIFAYMWWKGHLEKITAYVRQTREELRKCTWPTWDELKGSTVLVTLSIALLGVFTVVVDRIFFYVVLWISKV